MYSLCGGTVCLPKAYCMQNGCVYLFKCAMQFMYGEAKHFYSIVYWLCLVTLVLKNYVNTVYINIFSPSSRMADIIQKFYSDLIKILPMNDTIFRSELYTADLLPGNLKSQIRLHQTSADKAELFLDDGIKNDVLNFKKLIAVMEKYDDSVKKLAAQINSEICPQQTIPGMRIRTWSLFAQIIHAFTYIACNEHTYCLWYYVLTMGQVMSQSIAIKNLINKFICINTCYK